MRNKAPRLALRRACAAALLAGLIAAPGAGHAQSGADPAKKLQDVERQLQSKKSESERQKARAEMLKAELAGITAQLVEAARRVQDQEAKVAELEGQLAALRREADQKALQLRERRRQFSGVVMALSRIARFPPEALIAQPVSPEDTVRSAILLRAAVPAIETRANSLKAELDDLARARERVALRRTELDGAMARLRAEEGRIDAMRKQKAALRAEAISKGRAAQSQARRLAREAGDLRELMARLETERKRRAAAAEAKAKASQAAKAPSQLHVQPDAQPQPPQADMVRPDVDVAALGGIGSISKARGRLPFPVVGRLVGLYGQPLESDMTRKGLSVESRPGAQVIAPFDGTVVFAGPFRGYGQLLIIDHGEGYHSLLAGLGRIDVSMGLSVLAGEPVAVMPSGNNSGGDGGESVLYVEFRRDNQPINPLPWLASRKGTPQG